MPHDCDLPLGPQYLIPCFWAMKKHGLSDLLNWKPICFIT